MAAVEEEEVVALQFQEVANYQGTIEEAASAGVIPQPELMPFNMWQQWRKTVGLHPCKRLGSQRATTTSEEANLWRRVMEAYHGEELGLHHGHEPVRGSRRGRRPR